MGGHEGRCRHPADRRSPPVLHPQHPARRRERRLQRQSAAARRIAPAPNYGQGTFAANPVPHTRDGQRDTGPFPQLGHARDTPPPSRYPLLGGHSGPDGNLVDATKKDMGFPTIPGVPPSAPTGLINPVLRVRLRPRFRLQRRIGRPDGGAAEDQEGHSNARPESGCRRQRARRGAGGAAGCAARHVSGMEHHRGRVPQGQDLQLCRRHDPVREDAG